MSGVRDAAKGIALGVARATGAIRLARRAHRRCLRILAYHGVEPSADAWLNFDGFHVSPDLFRKHLEILCGQYCVLTLDDAMNALAGGEPLPDNAVAITFDDGYLNNLQSAAPMLREFGVSATFFVTTGFMDGTHRPWWFDLRQLVGHASAPSLHGPDGSAWSLRTAADRTRAVVNVEGMLKSLPGRRRTDYLAALAQSCGTEIKDAAFPMMSPDDVRKLASMGFDVCPHTVSHISMGAEAEADVVEEIRESIHRIISVTGRHPRCYSYPYGRPEDLPDSAVIALRGEDLIGALTTTQEMNAPGADPMRLGRLNITGRHGRAAFEALVAGFTLVMRGEQHR